MLFPEVKTGSIVMLNYHDAIKVVIARGTQSFICNEICQKISCHFKGKTTSDNDTFPINRTNTKDRCCGRNILAIKKVICE